MAGGVGCLRCRWSHILFASVCLGMYGYVWVWMGTYGWCFMYLCIYVNMYRCICVFIVRLQVSMCTSKCACMIVYAYMYGNECMAMHGSVWLVSHSLELLTCRSAQGAFGLWEFCATLVLPYAMPCWDDCCVDESPEINLSGEKMADDRRTDRAQELRCLIHFRGLCHFGRSISTTEKPA